MKFWLYQASRKNDFFSQENYHSQNFRGDLEISWFEKIKCFCPATSFCVKATNDRSVVGALFHASMKEWILCSYWPIVRSTRENIRTEVLKYGLNEVRSVRKTEVRIFSRMDRTNWSIRALLYSHNQRSFLPTPFINSVLNIFVSSLNAAVGREIFSSPISFKVKLSIKKVKLAWKFLSSLLFLFIEEGIWFPGPIRLFGGPIRLWTERKLTNQIVWFYLATQ